ncbi:hypothetical protein [Gilvimarinus polysaccharolyticus]|uniref:hypothetical protein n=1 Tax=Gilvimarinus polysaccharolyticus TaxID=863921 RepID=UPI0006733001|nr:hypothetical protein [Gilvimarinus polysaccharolyticus]
MKHILILIGILFSALAYSSMPLEVSLEELVENSDHLLVGHVVGVDMIDSKGEEITNLSARTGPGGKNLIRLIIKVDEVVVSSVETVPDTLKVPLDPFMHYSLGQIKEAHSIEGEKTLLLLKGANFQPPFAGIFRRNLSERQKIIELIKSNK